MTIDHAAVKRIAERKISLWKCDVADCITEMETDSVNLARAYLALLAEREGQRRERDEYKQAAEVEAAAGDEARAELVALRSRLEEAELENKRLVTALELCRTTLAAIREKCEQAKNGSLRTTIRAIHQLAGGPDNAK